MGQATVDLPDPLEPPDVNDANASATVAAAPLGAADDLLAQLAGEEIDRLLAEADAEMPPVAPPAPVARVEMPSTVSQEAAADGAHLGDVLDNAAKLAATPVEPASPVAPSPTEPSSAEPSPAEPTPVGTAPVETAPAMTPAERELESLIASSAEPTYTIADLNTTADESAALLGDPSALHSTEATGNDRPADSSEPFLVRVLEILNAPASRLSNGAREVIGKIAILTLFNALAVLLYVLMFRHHH